MIHWHCHDVFHRMPAGATAGGVAVVIDVLRASTTMITALVPGLSALGAVVFLGEPLSWNLWAGLALVTGGILFGVRQAVVKS